MPDNCKKFRKTKRPKCEDQPDCMWVSPNCVSKKSSQVQKENMLYNDNGIIKLKQKFFNYIASKEGIEDVYETLDGVEYVIAKSSSDLRSMIGGMGDDFNVVTTLVHDTSHLFASGRGLDGVLNIPSWDVSSVINMEHMFSGATDFNEDLSRWNTQNVVKMDGMFENCSTFNQDLSNWNVSSAISAKEMFEGALLMKDDHFPKFPDSIKSKLRVKPKSSEKKPKSSERKPKSVKKKQKRTYSKVPVELNINGSKPKKQPSLKLNRINLEEFKKLVDTNEDFINNFRKSLISLYKYKLDTYSNEELLPPGITDGVIKRDAHKIYKELANKIRQKSYDMNSPNYNKTIKENLQKIINDPEFGFYSLIGRENVMNQLVAILYAFSKNYKTITKKFFNISLFGGAGVGKSALAKVIAFTFKNTDILINGNIVMATKSDLIGQYRGQTSPKVRAQMFDSLEGIFFLDEAYSLGVCPGDNENQFSEEAIAELINFMDKTIGLQIVIVAGYKDKMLDCFFSNNEGLDRRFPTKLTLANYSTTDLTNILINNLLEKDVEVNEATGNLIYSLIEAYYEKAPSIFKNQAGDMLNLADSIIMIIYSSIDLEWNNTQEETEIIIWAGFEDFVRSKGLNIS